MGENGSGSTDEVIATIENRENPSQVVKIRYVKAENGFCTIGFREYFGQREVLIPTHLVAADLQLMGTILSAILERLSVAEESGVSFQYAQRFDVLDKSYTLTEWNEFMKLEES